MKISEFIYLIIFGIITIVYILSKLAWAIKQVMTDW